MSDIVQSLWIGSRLSTMEILSINSFIKNGNTYHLFVYEDIDNAPDGAVILDGNNVLPESDIFAYGRDSGAGYGSLAAFSNIFRYELLNTIGGTWVDTDLVCLQKFDFDDPYIFAQGDGEIGGWVLRAPPGSAILDFYQEECGKKNLRRAKYGEIGPQMVEAGVNHFDLHQYVKPYNTFNQFSWRETEKLIDPDTTLIRNENVYAVHLWHEMWRRSRMDKDGTYSEECVYEQLKKEFL